MDPLDDFSHRKNRFKLHVPSKMEGFQGGMNPCGRRVMVSKQWCRVGLEKIPVSHAHFPFLLFMGNHVTLETTELGSQLYDPLILTSDTFLAKSYVQLYVQGPDFVDVDGEVCFSVRQTTHIAFWKRSVECVHSDGNVVASLRSGVTYAGKSLDQPTGLFKTRRIRKISKILISGGKQVQASVDSKGKKAVLHRGNSTIAIVDMAAADKWTLILAPGVDMTLGIFFVETVKRLFN